MSFILGLPGSLRTASASTGMLRAASANLPKGSRMQIASIQSLPLFNKDIDSFGRTPDAVRNFRENAIAADAFLFAIPENTFGISGPMKNALDWGYKNYGVSEMNVFSGKVFAVVGVGQVNSPSSYSSHLKDWAKSMNMKIVDRTIYVNRNSVESNAFDQNGNVINKELQEDLRVLMEEIVNLSKGRLEENSSLFDFKELSQKEGVLNF